jgi:hypothetical protein
MGIIIKKIIILSGLILSIAAQSLLLSQVPDHTTDTVKCRSDINQSYALYLPAQYDSKKSWPVIFIFDPGAKGKSGVNTFLEAARKYGFILACSNNSHNGPVKDNFIAAAAMIRDVGGRFTLDRKRIYAAGFSGGSRFAISLAVKDGIFAGVIGCGAGLPNDGNYLPSAVSDFLYYGTAGKRDMNYPEMLELSVFFANRTRVNFYLRTFIGGHQWPENEVATDAVEWLILQSMARKIVPTDEKFISYLENKTEALINAEMSTGNTIDAVRYIRSASNDFQGTPYASMLSQKLSALENSADYKAASRRLSKSIETERQNEEKYVNHLQSMANSARLGDSASVWWIKETKSLTRLRDKGSVEESQMASRVMNFLSILSSEQGTAFYKNKTYTKAALLFEICTYSDSENQNNYYNLARSLAGAGKSKGALVALSGAVSHGFNSRKTVEADPVFGTLRNEPGYNEIMNKIK